ncbi:bifunctional lysylphosphatidylglycerol flippase/synthetase MprF [Subtercola endophyticus]|uniref:bifunctional lysylphosphatidylglycerol flippase/synthetase MprF n=1 Tax=Subtercola endophyticus TaxID=2895559 RepID=UPI001E5ABE44|nr:DUF2156 domain-containing protein [Subtercola endophyticus]UFS59237.1 DUF2156 domain-containing protein [Subtercola endophyticus]
MKPVLTYVRAAPVSVGLAIIVIVTSIVTGTIVTPATTGGDSLVWAAGVPTTIDSGWWWTPLTALFVPNDLASLIISVVLALTLLAVCERLIGSLRTAAAFLLTGIVGILVGVVIQQLGVGLGESWAVGSAFDFTLDPTIGIIGALLTASGFAQALWRRRIRLITFAIVLVFVLYSGDQDNFYRLLAALAGLALGALWSPRTRGSRHGHSSQGESRNLVAVIVAISAIGPLIALLPPGGNGPLSFVQYVFGASNPDADATLAACANDFSAECDRNLALVSAGGVSPLLLGLVPLVLLIIAAIGLRRGRRFAWLLAIVVNAALIVLSIVTLGLGDITIDASSADVTSIETLFWILATVLAPVALIVTLGVTRLRFQIRAPKAAVRRFGIIVATAFVVLAVLYLIVGAASIDDYVPDANFGDLLLDTIRRFVPTGFDTGLGPVIVPAGGFALFVYQWVGVVFWAITVGALIQLFAAVTQSRSVSEEEHFRRLLRLYGGGTLGFMGTWAGNVYWFSADGEAAVAYRVINGVAITLSDPICDPDRGPEVIGEFISFCDANSYVCVFYSFHEQYVPVFEQRDWQYMSVGEETLMAPVTLDMAGKPWQKVRQALNRGTKAGITTLWTTWDELPVSLSNQINAISEQWVAEKELPEMGFTLGAMQELKDPDVKLFLAIGPDGDMQAITSWLPDYRDGEVVSYTIDFMRRGDNSIGGIMEFVIASAALHMQKDGIAVLSLSAAPLAEKPVAPGETPPEPTVMTRLLGFLAQTLEPAYGFSTLFKFKSKFNPTHSTIYMAYADPVTLPVIGAAIGSAYLPHATPKEYLALAKTLRK